jgi:Fic family protein
MTSWNWQKKNWPEFTFEKSELSKAENDFLYSSGALFAVYQHLHADDLETLRVQIIADEALKTSEIEGEILSRDSLQSSIRRNFGLKVDQKKIPPAEKGIADLMTDLYKNFAEKLTHKTLFQWHEMLMSGRGDLQDVGKYRTHLEPMQILSAKLYEPKVHFEAPPSKMMKSEMTQFISWFNDSAPNGKNPLPALTRAGIAHLYFVAIHPFEDDNGRIARSLSIKALSQSLNQPLLTSLSTIIQSKKKKYYDALEENNKNLEITNWLKYFSETFLESQNYTRQLIDFLIAKNKLYQIHQENLNGRQKKVLERMFREGIKGFEGGLNAEKYLAITKTSRATATRDLQDLLELKVFKKTGEGRWTRYSLNLNHK